MAKKSKHVTFNLPTEEESLAKKSKHVTFKLPTEEKNHPLQPIKGLPVSIKLDASSAGLIGQVKKVQNRVSDLEKNLANEVAARSELHECVEKLKVENEVKQCMAQPANNNNVLHSLIKSLPCESLTEVDTLFAFVTNHSLEWIQYIKLLGGTDFNSAIKTVMDAIMTRSVQKQLSWSGKNSKKPSMKLNYKKGIIDGIHVAMKEQFKDYTIVSGEARMQRILQNAG